MTGQQVWMFSGQGSQYYRMGLDLYESDEVFRAAMDGCSLHVGTALGEPLTSVLFRERPDRWAPFDRIVHTHPALFSIQYSMAQALLSRGHRPAAIVGYSLGEWVALAVAGRAAAHSILDLLVQQAQQAESRCAPGRMLAVFAPPEMAALRADWFGETWVVARNFDRHFVVSGAKQAVEQVEETLKTQQITTQMLPVAQAFHTPMMDVLHSECMAGASVLSFGPARTRLWSARGEEVTEADPAQTLWSAVRGVVEFSETVAALESEGSPVYVDCGPSGTLANFVRYNLPRSQHHRCIALMTPSGGARERLEKMAAARTAAGGHA